MSDGEDYDGAGGNFARRSLIKRTPPSVGSAPPSIGKRPLTSPTESQPAPTRARTERTMRAESMSRRGPPVTAAATPAPSTPASLVSMAPPTPAPVAGAMPKVSSVPTSASVVKPSGGQASTSSKLEQLDCVRGAVKKIVGLVQGPGSKLNKADIGTIFGHGQEILGVVAALELQLADAEYRAEMAETKLASAAVQNAVMVDERQSVARVGPVMSFASALKMGKGIEPKPIKANQGPVLAFYPAEEAAENSSELTKAALKKAIDPRAISVQIERVRKLGNAGVLVQTTSVESAERLKKAVPASLRVVEPKRRLPLVALQNVDGDPSFEHVVEELWELNFDKDPEWPLATVQAAMKGVFKRSRKGSPYQETTVVFECSSRMREALVVRGTVFIGWQQVEVCDYVRVTCCNKCQQYGHPEKFCRAKEETCGRCGEVGHRADKCGTTILCCATCKRFKRDSTHRTASRTCPARLYAEEQLIQQIQYG